MRFAEFTEGYSAGAVGGAGIGEATMDPDFKHELNKILSRNWKGASAEKILLDRFLNSPEGAYARNIIGNDAKGWIKHIEHWLGKNKQKITQEFSELDINDLDELAYNMYTSYMSRKGQLDEKWSSKYKKSINCSNPKGFSQKAHCAGRKARQAGKHTKSSSVNEYGEVPRQRKIEFSKENPPPFDHLYQQFIQTMLSPDNNIQPQIWIDNVNKRYGLSYKYKDYQNKGHKDYTNNWDKVVKRYILNKV